MNAHYPRSNHVRRLTFQHSHLLDCAQTFSRTIPDSRARHLGLSSGREVRVPSWYPKSQRIPETILPAGRRRAETDRCEPIPINQGDSKCLRSNSLPSCLASAPFSRRLRSISLPTLFSPLWLACHEIGRCGAESPHPFRCPDPRCELAHSDITSGAVRWSAGFGPPSSAGLQGQAPALSQRLGPLALCPNVVIASQRVRATVPAYSSGAFDDT